MKCVYCDKVVSSPRKKGDHVIPQGFGRTNPELVLYNVCTSCDAKNGNKHERSIMRKGISGFIRMRLKIKSRNSKSKILFNPIRDKKNNGKNQYIDLTMESDGFLGNPSFDNDGSVYRPFFATYYLSESEIKEEINQKLSVKEIVSHVNKRAKKLGSAKIGYSGSKDLVVAVREEFIRQGGRSLEVALLPEARERIGANIKVTFDKSYIVGCANVLFKTLLVFGYEPAYLKSIRRLIRTGRLLSNERAIVSTELTEMSYSDDISVEDYTHRIEWHIDKNYIHAFVCLWGIRSLNKRGVVSCFRLTLGKGRSVLIPNGALLANYLQDSSMHLFGYTGNDLIIKPTHLQSVAPKTHVTDEAAPRTE